MEKTSALYRTAKTSFLPHWFEFTFAIFHFIRFLLLMLHAVIIYLPIFENEKGVFWFYGDGECQLKNYYFWVACRTSFFLLKNSFSPSYSTKSLDKTHNDSEKRNLLKLFDFK